MEEKILIVYHHIGGDCDSLVSVYKPENIGCAETFIKAIKKDEDMCLDYVIIGRDFAPYYLEKEDKPLKYETYSGEQITF